MYSFHAFYEKLYSSDTTGDPLCISQFLDNLPIPTLEDRHRDRLEALKVIKSLKKGSAPGLDGLSVPYYKVFDSILAPYLARFFNYKRKGGTVRLTFKLNLHLGNP